MTFDDVVSEELGTDLDAIKAQIKQLQVNVDEKDKIIGEKDIIIKNLQTRLAGATVPKQEPKTGVGTRRTINKPANAPQAEGI